MPCDLNNIDINLPDGPSAPSIPGFGTSFSLKLPPNLFQLPGGFPESLNDILNALQLILPPGTIKPALNPNFGKDIFDGIMKLLDQFFPFLMLYKFFLPLLNLIVCIIEVICSLKNPFKLRRAIKRLFRNCIPEFLSLFPIFAIIIMLISLLLLLIQLIEYIIDQLKKLIERLLRNIKALTKAIQLADEEAILAISKKIAALLCVFQNLFVILSVFGIIIQAIKEILKIQFKIPPCDSDDSANISQEQFLDQCCGTDVCPAVATQNIQKSSGSFQHLNKVVLITPIDVGYVVDPKAGTKLTQNIRSSTFQLYDTTQSIEERFLNVVDAYDIPPYISPKPIFFPTDASYSAATDPKQAAYTVDLKIYYNPASYGRFGESYGTQRFIIFKDCIVTGIPTMNLVNYNNSISQITSGVINLAGGLGYEEDGTTKLLGFADDGYTFTASQATLENFLTLPAQYSENPELLPTDGYLYNNAEYTFKPNFDLLFSKDLVTGGCAPDVSNDRNFINATFGGDANLRYQLLNSLVNDDGTSGGQPPFRFPNIQKAQECLELANQALISNVNEEQIAIFTATTTACLENLGVEANNAIIELVGIGFDQYKSTFTVDPTTQFTTKGILIKVDLLDSNSQPLTTNLPESIASSFAEKLSANITFGEVSKFVYDGSRYFNASITSSVGGSGSVSVDYDNKSITTITIPDTLDEEMVSTIKTVEYKFIFTSALSSDETGQPRRDISDITENR